MAHGDLRDQANGILRELEEEPGWDDLEERTSPAIHLHLPREPMPSAPEGVEQGPALSPRARLIVAVVVAILGALGARWGL